MLNICIAAYNEEKNIKNSLKYLEKSLISIGFYKKVKIFVCLNGCNDKTKKEIKEIKEDFSFPLLITCSRKGKIKAHKKMIENIDNNEYIFFMDADVLVPEKTILDLLREFEKDKYVKIVSAYPYVDKGDYTFFKRFLFNVLNLKRIYPKIEIAKNDVSMYHDRKLISNKSRIYFHGRFFGIRNKSVYEFPKKNSKIRGDDTFLTRTTLNKYGRGSIKVLFSSRVYCAPLMSIKSYLKSWYRIRKDIDQINSEYPEFKKYNDKIIMVLDWKYIKKLGCIVKVYAFCFLLLRKFETISYVLFKKYINLDSVWSYDKKEITKEKVTK